MNFGIGYDFFSVFLRSDDYRIVSKIAYAALLICPFIFYYVKKYSAMLIIYMSAAFISVKLMSLYIMWGSCDEGQHLLMVNSLINGGVPFRDFEGQSLGPLNAAFLALFSFGKVSFFTARLGALFAELLSAVMIFLAIRKLCGVRSAIALSCPILFYYSIYFFDVTGYNCETLFTLLISLWLLLFAFRRDNRRTPFAECLVLGLLPWIKLQFAPFSVLCFIISLARGVFIEDKECGCYRGSAGHKQSYRQHKYSQFIHALLSKNALIALIAGLLPSLIFFAYLALTDALEWFWMFYIVGNLEHVSVSLSTYLAGIGAYFFAFANMDMFWMATGTPSAFIILSLSNKLSAFFRSDTTQVPRGMCVIFVFCRNIARYIISRRGTAIVLLILFAITSIFAVTRTMSLFTHYVNILVPCGAILVALGLTVLKVGKRRLDQWTVAMLIVASIIFGGKLATYTNIKNVQDNGFPSEQNYAFIDALHYLNERVRPGEPVALWGWETNFAIYSDHPSATSTHYIYPLVNPKFTHKMQDKYVMDILYNKPAAVIDLVGPAAFSYKEKQYELANYDFIRVIMDKYYEKPVSIPTGNDGSVRIYLRKKGL